MECITNVTLDWLYFEEPTLTVDEMEEMEKTTIKLDNGPDEPSSYVKAVFLPSAFFSQAEKMMDGTFSTPSEYITYVLREILFFSRGARK